MRKHNKLASVICWLVDAFELLLTIVIIGLFLGFFLYTIFVVGKIMFASPIEFLRMIIVLLGVALFMHGFHKVYDWAKRNK